MPLIRETLDKLIRREKTKKITKSLVLVPLFTSLFSMSVLAAAPENMSSDTAIHNINVSFQDPSVFIKNINAIEIVPGDSKDQKEQAEKAKLEAEKKAKATLASRQTISRERRVYNDPSDFNSIYESAGAMFGVSPALLKAIHTVETGASGSTSRSNPSGATGPMQFLQSTFNRHGVDGNGDGIKDISNVHDAIYSAAAYLKACGYPDLKKALWGYNPSTRYYNKVMELAYQFGM